MIYASRLLDKDELLTILNIISRKKNENRDITGILLYKTGNFLQVLEGPEDTVTEIYDTICADEPHHQIMTISKRPITTRDFPEWKMAFVNLNKLDPGEVPGYSDYLNEPFDVNTFAQRPSLAYSFVRVFKENMR